MDEEWFFYGAPYLNKNFEEVRFKITKGGERFSCVISYIALKDHEQLESEMNPIDNFGLKGKIVLKVAVRLIAQGAKRESDGIYFISSEQFKACLH